MMAADDGSCRLNPYVPGNDVESEKRMHFHDFEFCFGKFAHVQQDAVWNADLADVVKKGAGDQRGDLLFRPMYAFSQGHGIERDPVVMRAVFGSRLAAAFPSDLMSDRLESRRSCDNFVAC